MAVEQLKSLPSPTLSTKLWDAQQPFRFDRSRYRMIRELIEYFWGKVGWKYFKSRLWLGKDAVCRRRLEKQQGAFTMEDGIAIQQHFTNTVRRYFDLADRVDMFFSRNMRHAHDLITDMLGSIGKDLVPHMSLNSDINAFPYNYHECLDWLGESAKTCNPTASFEIERALFLAYVFGLIEKRTEQEQHSVYFHDVQEVVSRNVLAPERRGENHWTMLYTVHDSFTNQVYAVGEAAATEKRYHELLQQGKDIHVKSHPMKARNVVYQGGEAVEIYTQERQKNKNDTVLKLINKALKNGGKLDLEGYVEDALGIYYVVLDPTKSTRNLEKVILHQLRDFFRQRHTSFSYTKNHYNDSNHGQSPYNRFRRYDLVINGVKFELIFYEAIDYFNSAYMVRQPADNTLPPLIDAHLPELPDYHSERGGDIPEAPIESVPKKADALNTQNSGVMCRELLNGPAHQLYKLRRNLDVLRWLFPVSIYGPRLQEAIVDLMHKTAQDLLEEKKFTPYNSAHDVCIEEGT